MLRVLANCSAQLAKGRVKPSTTYFIILSKQFMAWHGIIMMNIFNLFTM